MERADEALRGNKDNIEGEIEESADEINDSTFTMTKRKYARGQQMWAVPQRQRGVILLGEKRKDGVEGIKSYVIEKGVNWFLRKINCIIIKLIQ